MDMLYLSILDNTVSALLGMEIEYVVTALLPRTKMN